MAATATTALSSEYYGQNDKRRNERSKSVLRLMQNQKATSETARDANETATKGKQDDSK